MSKKRHHYVSEFYLAGFADPNDEPFVWVHEKGKKARKSRPHNIGFENYFYAFRDSKGIRDTDSLENAFERIEYPAFLVFEKIRNHKTIYEKDMRPFAAFVALMLTRVPSFRDLVNRIAIMLVTEKQLKIASDPEAFKKYIAQFEAEQGRLDIDIPLEEFRQSILSQKYKIKPGPGLRKYHLEFISMAATAEELLLKMNWSFYRATAKTKFLTSDNPVFINGIKLDHPSAELYFSVWRESLFVAHWGSQERQVEYKQAPNDKKIQANNWLMISSAHRYVYSSWTSDELQGMADKAIGTMFVREDLRVKKITTPFD